MKKSYIIDINTYALLDVLMMYNNHSYPREVQVQLSNFIDFLEDTLAINIPSNFDIIDEHWTLTYDLKQFE